MTRLKTIQASQVRPVVVKEIPFYPDWIREGPAACLEVDPEIFYNYGRNTRKIDRAKAVCQQCPVRMQCLKENLLVPHGIYGGFTYLERYRLRYGADATPSKGFAFSYFEHVYMTPKGDLKTRSTAKQSRALKSRKSYKPSPAN